MKFETIGGRRFIIMLLVIILMSLLVYIKSIPADIYGDVIKWIVMAYIA